MSTHPLVALGIWLWKFGFLVSYVLNQSFLIMEYINLTSKIISKALQVHTVLGPGMLERVYEACLEYELNEAGIAVQRQLILPIQYKGIQFNEGYRIDLLIEKTVVLEIKAVEKLNPVHYAQVLSYMKLGGFPVGLILNFNVKSLKEGIKRFVLKDSFPY